MKMLIVMALSLVMMSAFAAKVAPKGVARKVAQEAITCSDNVSGQISTAPECSLAIEVAETCANGDSTDVAIANSARVFCETKDLKSISKPDAALKAAMEKRCATLCNPRNDGTSCQARIAFCNLDVIKFILSFY